MINQDRISDMGYAMYQAALRHSTKDADYHKLIEEDNEFYAAALDECAPLDDAIYGEFADKFWMSIRWLFYATEPKSEQEARLIYYRTLESLEYKFDRQMNERGWSK